MNDVSSKLSKLAAVALGLAVWALVCKKIYGVLSALFALGPFAISIFLGVSELRSSPLVFFVYLFLLYFIGIWILEKFFKSLTVATVAFLFAQATIGIVYLVVDWFENS